MLAVAILAILAAAIVLPRLYWGPAEASGTPAATQIVGAILGPSSSPQATASAIAPAPSPDPSACQTVVTEADQMAPSVLARGCPCGRLRRRRQLDDHKGQRRPAGWEPDVARRAAGSLSDSVTWIADFAGAGTGSIGAASEQREAFT